MMSLKFSALPDGSIEVRGVGIPFRGPLSGKDLHGQFFSEKTDFAWDLIPDGQRPLLYQHGMDDAVKTNVIGRWKVEKIDDKGVWVRAQLDSRAEYLNEIKQLLEEDALGFSSATMGHLVKVAAKTGEILSWPVVELSLTPNPANPAAYVVKSAKQPADYAKARLAVLKDYNPDQPRDEAGRFSSGGGGGDSSPAYPSGYGLQGTEEERAAVRAEISKLSESPEQTGFPAYVASLNQVEAHLAANNISGAIDTSIAATRDAGNAGHEGVSEAFSNLASTLDDIGADAYADFMTGVDVPGFGEKSARTSRKYSEDQPRDERGRFGSSGAGAADGGSTAAVDAAHANISKEISKLDKTTAAGYATAQQTVRDAAAVGHPQAMTMAAGFANSAARDGNFGAATGFLQLAEAHQAAANAEVQMDQFNDFMAGYDVPGMGDGKSAKGVTLEIETESEDEDYDNDDWETYADVAKHAASCLIEVLEMAPAVAGDAAKAAALRAVVSSLETFISAVNDAAVNGEPLPAGADQDETDLGMPVPQPAASLAIVAGTATASTKADLDGLKEQLRAFARETALKTTGRK